MYVYSLIAIFVTSYIFIIKILIYHKPWRPLTERYVDKAYIRKNIIGIKCIQAILRKKLSKLLVFFPIKLILVSILLMCMMLSSALLLCPLIWSLSDSFVFPHQSGCAIMKRWGWW